MGGVLGLQNKVQLDALVQQISLSVIQGQSLDATMHNLEMAFGGKSQLLVDARLEYEKRCLSNRYEPFPPVIVREGIKKRSWYPGTQQGDKYWPRTRNRLAESSGLDEEVLIEVEKQTNKIMSLLDPPGDMKINTRGLVLGYVQSGKTTSFVSLISKAADVGYKFFIVLSGMTDSLRQQTQDRIDDLLLAGSDHDWYQLTDHDRDFHESPKNSGNLLRSHEKRFISVVKKNQPRLKRLKQWLEDAGQTTLANTPILIIDDEADQGSINTAKEGARRSSINQLIIDLLKTPKSGYVAYTATPFANLLVDPNESDDLYPRDFVISLPKPEGYFGSEKLFGTSDYSDQDEIVDVIRSIGLDESIQMVPPRKTKNAIAKYSPEVGPALRQSLIWFLLATTARRIRTGGKGHSTMLIHTSMQAASHEAVAVVVRKFLDELSESLSSSSSMVWEEFQNLYLREIQRVSPSQFGNKSIEWPEVRNNLSATLRETKVLVDNYVSEDTLIYDKEFPTTAIAIGGNRLSRGLTLEGLCSSYFVRSASAYDTLLQMGRWFGYRKGYEDLCRIWITEELKKWFRDLSLVESEIRQDILRYEVEDLQPSQVGVRIRSHPAMAITARAKMRSAVLASMTYSGQSPQTTLFSENTEWLRTNVLATKELIRDIQNSGKPEKSFPSGKVGFSSVEASTILDFINKYEFHPDKPSLNRAKLVEYIQGEIKAGSLNLWNVVIKEGSDESVSIDLGLNQPVSLLQRTKIIDSEAGQVNLRAVSSPGDRLLDSDLTPSEISKRLSEQTGTEDSISLRLRQEEFANRGLLCIYPIAGQTATKVKPTVNRAKLELEENIIAVSFYFPYALGRYTSVDYMTADLSSLSLEVEDDEFSEIEIADSKDATRLEEGD